MQAKELNIGDKIIGINKKHYDVIFSVYKKIIDPYTNNLYVFIAPTNKEDIPLKYTKEMIHGDAYIDDKFKLYKEDDDNEFEEGFQE